jgi:putative ABC transport system ATP-binding protein
MALVKVEHVKKIYQSKLSREKVEALVDVNFEVEEGEFVAIMGESGSGKSTLLNILATLDTPTSGKVELAGQDITTVKEGNLAAYRRDHLGFVFQDFNLLDTFSVKENIVLPMVLAKRKLAEMDAQAEKLAKLLNIEDLMAKYPYELSGGQKQRVAVARALMMTPELILADEPTGALDSKNSEELLDLFEKINAEKQTILMVTHSSLAASRASRVLFIRDGKVFHQLYRAGQAQATFLNSINLTMTSLLSKGE